MYSACALLLVLGVRGDVQALFLVLVYCILVYYSLSLGCTIPKLLPTLARLFACNIGVMQYVIFAQVACFCAI